MMMKNLILLAVLAWVSFSYAKSTVVQEDLKEGEAYKVEAPVEDVKREVAGGKFKKKPVEEKEASQEQGSDSEVQYWQYSE